MRRRRKAILFVLYLAVVLPLLLELAAWAVMVDCWPAYLLPHQYPRVEVQTYCGPVSANWIANSLGFHDVEHPRRKPAGELRVACVGDSFLDGPQQEPLPLRLRRRLQERPEAWDVINLGKPGLEPNLYYVVLRDLALDFDPDLVLVFLFEGNDFLGMEKEDPGRYDRPQGLLRRYPVDSWYGRVLPRTTILLHDATAGEMIFRWSRLDGSTRWGKVLPAAGSLEQLARMLTWYVQADEQTLARHVGERLTPEELEELLRHPVRLDYLAYLTGLGLGATFTERLAAPHRAAIADPEVAAAQVASVLAFLSRMQQRCQEQEVAFRAILIPTSRVDPRCQDLYQRLAGPELPPLARARGQQWEELKHGLERAAIPFDDLADVLSASPGAYLRFDTHWTDHGVDVAVEHLLEQIPGWVTGNRSDSGGGP